MTNIAINQLQQTPQNEVKSSEDGSKALEAEALSTDSESFDNIFKSLSKPTSPSSDKSSPLVEETIDVTKNEPKLAETSEDELGAKVIEGEDEINKIDLKNLLAMKQPNTNNSKESENTEHNKKLTQIISKDQEIDTNIKEQKKGVVEFKSASNEVVKIKSILGPKVSLEKVKDLPSKEKEMSVKSNKEIKVDQKSEILDNVLDLNKTINQKTLLNAYGKPERNSFFVKPEIIVENSSEGNQLKNDKELGDLMINDSDHSLEIEEAKQFIISKNNNDFSPKIATPISKSVGINLESLNTTNLSLLMDKISEHISLQKLNGMDSLDLNVNHDSLGQFNIKVSKVNNSDNINLQIVSTKNETMEFFKMNENNMMKSLQNVGVKIGDIKLVSTLGLAASQTGESMDQKSNDSNSLTNGNDSPNFGHKNQNMNQDSRKRKELWNYYKEQMSA